MTAQDDPGTIVKTSGCPMHGQNKAPCGKGTRPPYQSTGLWTRSKPVSPGAIAIVNV
ncbi:hypothetical protein GCM10027269_01110 [Kribbella endophytica]